jgi:hypothetical protein
MALIEEEVTEHKCRELTDVWAIDGKFWIGDGVRYYLLPPTFSEQPDRNTRKGNTTKNLVTTRILVIF